MDPHHGDCSKLCDQTCDFGVLGFDECHCCSVYWSECTADKCECFTPHVAVPAALSKRAKILSQYDVALPSKLSSRKLNTLISCDADVVTFGLDKTTLTQNNLANVGPDGWCKVFVIL